MPGRIEMKLAELDITLPSPMPPIANYVPYAVTGNLVVVSGQVPAPGRISPPFRAVPCVVPITSRAGCRRFGCFTISVTELDQVRIGRGDFLENAAAFFMVLPRNVGLGLLSSEHPILLGPN